MSYIINNPIITHDTIFIRAEVEGHPEQSFVVQETNINTNDIPEKLIKNLEVIARLIGRKILEGK